MPRLLLEVDAGPAFKDNLIAVLQDLVERPTGPAKDVLERLLDAADGAFFVDDTAAEDYEDFPPGRLGVRLADPTGAAVLFVRHPEGVADAADIVFKPHGDVDRGMALLTEIVAGANALMQFAAVDQDRRGGA